MAAVAALAAAPTPRLGASTWNSATSVSSQSVAVRIACLFRSATYGFPYHGLLSTSGDFTLGNVTSLAGMGDDTRFLQMSTPIQPGNSGGPLLDMSGAVVGVVVAQLSAVNMMLAGSSVNLLEHLSGDGDRRRHRHEAFDCHAFKRNQQEECVQMPARSAPPVP